MKRLAAIVALVLGWIAPAAAQPELRIVATTPTLAALAAEVAGDRARIDSLANPASDPHFVDGRPSFVVALNRADLVVLQGMDLESGWLPPLLTNARNGKIQRGRDGYFDASRYCGEPLGIFDRPIDRRMGDVHPQGNPHYLFDPRYGLRVARALAERLAEIDPQGAAAYRASAKRLSEEMQKRTADWEALMTPHRGKSFVAFHESTIYLARWLGLKEAGFIEPVPGISPSPSHLADLILKMQRERIGVVLAEPWYQVKTAAVVAEKSGARLVEIPGSADSPERGAYARWIDGIIDSLTKAFESA